MEKHSLIVHLNESFEDEDNCVILHMIDGSQLLIHQKPSFHNLNMSVNMVYSCDGNTIVEKTIIPYSGVLYLTVTNNTNLKILHDFEFKKRMNDYELLDSTSSGVSE